MSIIGAALGGAFITGGMIYRSTIKSEAAQHEQAVMYHKANNIPPPVFSENAPMYRSGISTAKMNSNIAIVVGILILISSAM